MPTGIYERTKKYRITMAEAMQGNQNALGKLSPNKDRTYEEIYGIERATELKKKLRISHLGNKHTEEQKRNIGNANRNKKKPPRTEEHRLNLSLNHARLSGKNHPMFGKRGKESSNWKGGISKEPYSFSFNEELKGLIRFRDSYKCQKCGCPEIENNQKLSVHHIDYDKENCKPSNLVSLCEGCNSVVNFNRQEWTKYFQGKVKKIMNSNIIQLRRRDNDN